MSTNAIKLFKLLNGLINENVINEIGDLNNIEPYPLIGDSFQIDDKTSGKIDIHNVDEDEISHLTVYPKPTDISHLDQIVNIGYSIEGKTTQYAKYDVKVLLRVMKTLSNFVLNHIKQYPNTGVLVFEDNKNDNLNMEPGQKTLLYTKIIPQNIPSGYKMRSVSFGPLKGIIIFPMNEKEKLREERKKMYK